MFHYPEYKGLFDVGMGQVWSLPGYATLACGDLLEYSIEDVIELLRIEGRCTMYVDPPWNQGNMTTFYGKADLIRTRSFEDLCTHIWALAEACCDEAWIEMGNQHVDYLINEVIGERGRGVQKYDVTYYRKHPSCLVYAGLTRVSPRDDTFTGMDDEQTPYKALLQSKAGLVLDPCMGRGLTGVSAVKAGLPFAGMELNPVRFGITLERLVHLTGVAPERLV